MNNAGLSTGSAVTSSTRPRYAVVTPCRNEEAYLPRIIESVVNQTMRPAVWVIVDDGSDDQTAAIVEEAARAHDWIHLHKRPDRGARAVGGGVVEAFNDGLRQIVLSDYDYVCKLDADLGLPERYFESIVELMEADPVRGNLSGKTYIQTGSGRWVSERMGDENAIGPAKFYRVACFNDIGGFVKQASWDGIDGHRCRMHGWIAESIDREDLRIRHYRPQGTSQVSVWTGRKRWGRGKYFMGSSIMYVTAVSVYRMIERPFIIGGFGILCGYVISWMRRDERYDDRDYLRFFRRYERNSLLFGKRRTMQKYHDQIRKNSKRIGPGTTECDRRVSS